MIVSGPLPLNVAQGSSFDVLETAEIFICRASWARVNLRFVYYDLFSQRQKKFWSSLSGSSCFIQLSRLTFSITKARQSIPPLVKPTLREKGCVCEEEWQAGAGFTSVIASIIPRQSVESWAQWTSYTGQSATNGWTAIVECFFPWFRIRCGELCPGFVSRLESLNSSWYLLHISECCWLWH